MENNNKTYEIYALPNSIDFSFFFLSGMFAEERHLMRNLCSFLLCLSVSSSSSLSLSLPTFLYGMLLFAHTKFKQLL